MKLFLEIFLTKIVGDNIEYKRVKIDITDKAGNPDLLVLDSVKQHSEIVTAIEQNKVVSHSTSWHYEEPNECVLTYVVYCDLLKFNPNETAVLSIDMVETVEAEDYTHPRPKNLNTTHIISHGLKHIGFLVNEEPDKYSKVLSEHTINRLKHLNGVLAGKIYLQRQLSGLG